MAVPDPSDDEPLSDQANEPKAKARKQDPAPELVVVNDDDSTPLPGKQKNSQEVITSGGGSYRQTRTAPQGRGPSCAVQSGVSCPSGLPEQICSGSQGASQHR